MEVTSWNVKYDLVSRQLFEFDILILFDLILYVLSTTFQLNRDGSSWVESLLSHCAPDILRLLNFCMYKVERGMPAF